MRLRHSESDEDTDGFLAWTYFSNYIGPKAQLTIFLATIGGKTYAVTCVTKGVTANSFLYLDYGSLYWGFESVDKLEAALQRAMFRNAYGRWASEARAEDRNLLHTIVIDYSQMHLLLVASTYKHVMKGRPKAEELLGVVHCRHQGPLRV